MHSGCSTDLSRRRQRREMGRTMASTGKEARRHACMHSQTYNTSDASYFTATLEKQRPATQQSLVAGNHTHCCGLMVTKRGTNDMVD
mmetsp:Transcript_2512/g.7000  ORF Transcript_2512/g.7000 Transcript_2512/m.7000 type:complete len:87 (+) Transcript_2512:698-958(+)